MILKDKDLDSFRIKELKNYSSYDASLKEGDKFKAGDSVELILSGSYFHHQMYLTHIFNR